MTTTTSTNTILEDSQPAPHLRLRNSPELSAAVRRPILTHLSADNSWLVSLPLPITPNPSGDFKTTATKAYFHILLDAWLDGEEFATGRWFRVAEHTERPAYQTTEAIDGLIMEIEAAARGCNIASYKNEASGITSGMIDLIVVSSDATDHMHQATLISLPPKTPVCATEAAATAIAKWKHFEKVMPMPEVGTDLRDKAASDVDAIMPPWLQLFSLAGTVLFGILIAFPSEGDETDVKLKMDGIFHAPHGVAPHDLRAFLDRAQSQLETPLKLLALTHPLNGTSVAGLPATFGAHNGLKLQRMTDAKYWVRTHDEPVEERGIIAWLEGYQPVTFEEALTKEREENESGKDIEKPVFIDLSNRESFVLK